VIEGFRTRESAETRQTLHDCHAAKQHETGTFETQQSMKLPLMA
jgi:hypothetical protein